MANFKFEILFQSQKSRARAGLIHTKHGTIKTPGFVAVGTNGSIKALDSNDISQIGLQVMFANTYHLMLQPGLQVFEKTGGIHKLANIKIPLMTDSGGFQVFSLKYGGYTQELKSQGKKNNTGSVLKISEEGVLFRSYRDGEKIMLSPESSIQAQKIIGADMIVAFDELLPYHIDAEYQKNSLDRTHRWEERSLTEHKKNPRDQAIYSVIHGGIDKKMRRHSCETLANMDFDGMAIGGSVGKNLEEMQEMLSFLTPILPQKRPVHLLGIGDLPSIKTCIPLGIDTFDSSYPTKAARHGLLFSSKGNIRIMQSGNNFCTEAPENGCPCHTCRNFTVAYLSHLFKAHELTFYRLATIHNLTFMLTKMEDFRQGILDGQI